MLPMTGLKCCYDDGEGLRCAWGHVDESLKDETLSVQDLHERRVGLAAELSQEYLVYAEELQSAHDRAHNPQQMYLNLYRLAEHYKLSSVELGPPP